MFPNFVFGAATSETLLDGNLDDNVYWICSQTKLVTHLAALHLIERGGLAVDALVSDYLPQFKDLLVVSDITVERPTYAPAKNPILVRHLLNYTSGLYYPVRKERSYSLPYAYTTAHNPADPIGEFIDILQGDLAGVPIAFEPGTDFVYGFNSDILGFLVEIISGQSLELYLKKHFFGPLGIKTSFYLTPELKDKLVPLTILKGDKLVPFTNQTPLIEQDPSKVFRCLGGVGLYSTMGDYLTLLRHILQIYEGKAENPLLSEESVRSIFTPVLNETGSKSLDRFTQVTDGAQWGTAMAIATKDSPHGGHKKGSAFWSGWASTFGYIDPSTGVAFVFGSQTLPPHHPPVYQTFIEQEQALYARLNLNK